jgi:hypothetical protein
VTPGGAGLAEIIKLSVGIPRTNANTVWAFAKFAQFDASRNYLIQFSTEANASPINGDAP